MARRIRKNYRHITGLVSDGIGGALPFEGPIEIDFYTLMGHHLMGQKRITSIETQSITIDHASASGRMTRYTPEALIHFDKRFGIPPHLIEVKPVATLQKDWESEIKYKVRAGIRHARENGWVFKVFTEREVRTPYLENIKLLRIHRGHHFLPADLASIQVEVEKSPGVAFQTLLREVNGGGKGEARRLALSQIYHLLALGRISADLFKPIAYTTALMPANGWEEYPWDKRWLRKATPPPRPIRKGW